MELTVAIPDVVPQQRLADEAQRREHRQRIFLIGGQFDNEFAMSGTQHFDQCVAAKYAPHSSAWPRRIDDKPQLANDVRAVDDEPATEKIAQLAQPLKV